MDESYGPARALRAVWTARGQRSRVAHRLPTLSRLSPTIPQDQRQIIQGNNRTTLVLQNRTVLFVANTTCERRSATTAGSKALPQRLTASSQGDGQVHSGTERTDDAVMAMGIEFAPEHRCAHLPGSLRGCGYGFTPYWLGHGDAREDRPAPCVPRNLRGRKAASKHRRSWPWRRGQPSDTCRS